MIIGFFAPLRRATARSTRAGSTGVATRARGSHDTAGAVCANTSHGAAIMVGRGRPPVAWWKASATTADASAGCEMFDAHFVNMRMVANWSGISCRWPSPRPINAEGISLVNPTSGALAPYADSTAADAFNTPGPGTTENTPGRPVDCA
jgi:hypothetical protein